MRRIGRRGDVFPVQLLVTWVVFVLVAVLLFGLFWASAWVLKGKVASQDVAEANVAAADGGLALRSWLATRLDVPLDVFLPANASAPSVGAWNGTFADGLRAVLADPACVAALAADGGSYPRAGAAGYDAVYDARLPEGLCRAFFLRTVLYWRVVAHDDAFLLDAGAFSIGHGTDAPTLAGVQAVPGEPAVTLRLEVGP